MAIGAARSSDFSVAFATLKIDSRFGGTEVPLFVAVRSPQEWQSVRSKLLSSPVRDSAPYKPPSASKIDFARYTIIVAALGTRPSSGYTVLIRDVYEGSSRTVVRVIELAPGPHCIIMEELTHPVTVALIPKSTAPVEFIVNKASVDCEIPKALWSLK
jgi:hypothetical protein